MSPSLGSTLGSPPQREGYVLAQALDPERPSGRLEAVGHLSLLFGVKLGLPQGKVNGWQPFFFSDSQS